MSRWSETRLPLVTRRLPLVPGSWTPQTSTAILGSHPSVLRANWPSADPSSHGAISTTQTKRHAYLWRARPGPAAFLARLLPRASIVPATWYDTGPPEL